MKVGKKVNGAKISNKGRDGSVRICRLLGDSVTKTARLLRLSRSSLSLSSSSSSESFNSETMESSAR